MPCPPPLARSERPPRCCPCSRAAVRLRRGRAPLALPRAALRLHPPAYLPQLPSGCAPHLSVPVRLLR
eukprot:740816-Pleurochrysis_carterae.AAC.1